MTGSSESSRRRRTSRTASVEAGSRAGRCHSISERSAPTMATSFAAVSSKSDGPGRSPGSSHSGRSATRKSRPGPHRKSRLTAPHRARLDRGKWEAHFRKKIEPYMAGDRTERWVAETADHEFVGYLILGESGFMTPEAQGFIYDVWVTPDRRGTGVGKFLVEWASDWARQRGYRKIKLEVSETNARARHVYESLGFRPERRYMGKRLE